MSLRWLLPLLCAVAAADLVSVAPFVPPFLDFDGATWHKYVRAPRSRLVPPVRILPEHTKGNVSNADGLVSDHGMTILTRLSSDADIPTLVVDFGQNLAGLLSIGFAGAYNISPGLPGITLAFSETIQFLGERSDFTRSDNAAGDQKLTSGTDQIAVQHAPYQWTNQLGCVRDGQVCADGLHGFRYLKIQLHALPQDTPLASSLGSVSISSINLQYAGLHGTPDSFAGHFECSDPDITQWWFDAVYTTDLCTDVFLSNNTEPRDAASSTLLGKLVLHDGPKRDRDPYVGDLAVSALTSYISHGRHEAARNVLEDVASHQRGDGWIPPASINRYTLPLFDYSLWWVVCTRDHVMYSGNVSFLRQFHQVLVGTLDGYYVSHTNPATGLIERPEGYGDYAFLPRSGPVTYYNALYVFALGCAAELADAIGNTADAVRWRTRAAAIGAALIKRNFDEAAGAFFDGGSCPGAAICPTHAQDGNSLAILAGIASNMSLPRQPPGANGAESILSYLSRATARPYGNAFYDNTLLDPDGDFANRVYPFISYFELAARFSTSSTASSAFEELRRLYGWMATHDPTVTFWEGIGANGAPYEAGFTSMAHGWAGGIAPLMINYVLGVRPTKPGFAEWTVRPITNGGGLTWARGVVPTPRGEIRVGWEKNGKRRLMMLVASPSNTKGVVAVPVADVSALVSVNSTIVYDGYRGFNAKGVEYDDGFVVIPVDGGPHEFSAA